MPCNGDEEDIEHFLLYSGEFTGNRVRLLCGKRRKKVERVLCKVDQWQRC